MPGSVVALDSVSAIAVDTTNNVAGGRGGHVAATYYVDVSGIGAGDTWQVTLRTTLGTSVNITIAQTATFTSTGLKEIVLQAPFTSANRAVPSPDTILYDNTVAGGAPSLTARVWAIYGD